MPLRVQVEFFVSGSGGRLTGWNDQWLLVTVPPPAASSTAGPFAPSSIQRLSNATFPPATRPWAASWSLRPYCR